MDVFDRFRRRNSLIANAAMDAEKARRVHEFENARQLAELEETNERTKNIALANELEEQEKKRRMQEMASDEEGCTLSKTNAAGGCPWRFTVLTMGYLCL